MQFTVNSRSGHRRLISQVLGSVVAVAACSSSPTAKTGIAGAGGTGGTAGIDGSGGASAPCPAGLPTEGAPCPRSYTCRYPGTDPAGVCGPTADCAPDPCGAALHWHISQVSGLCGTHPQPCPNSFAAVSPGTTCPSAQLGSAFCDYPEGRCGCVMCVDPNIAGTLTTWSCRAWNAGTSEAACPGSAPLAGSPCNAPDTICLYSPCGQIPIGDDLQCTDGFWQERSIDGTCVEQLCGSNGGTSGMPTGGTTGALNGGANCEATGGVGGGAGCNSYSIKDCAGGTTNDPCVEGDVCSFFQCHDNLPNNGAVVRRVCCGGVWSDEFWGDGPPPWPVDGGSCSTSAAADGAAEE
jgi:hypothetical protein